MIWTAFFCGLRFAPGDRIGFLVVRYLLFVARCR